MPQIARDSRRDTLSKIKRDARSIPQLVFQIEEWEKQLVLVGRATKTNLMRDAKRSTNRDFKINMVVPGTQRGHSRWGCFRGGWKLGLSRVLFGRVRVYILVLPDEPLLIRSSRAVVLDMKDVTCACAAQPSCPCCKKTVLSLLHVCA